MLLLAAREFGAQWRQRQVLLNTLYQINVILEIGMADAPSPRDVEFMNTLTRTVLDRAKESSSELATLPTRLTDPSDAEAFNSFAIAAGAAYNAFLQRIETAAQQHKDLQEARRAGFSR